jgi:ubiquinone/menaquinone biosynthesis C-methylase UbiE
MLEIARMKFRPDELVEFRPADPAAVPFADNSFDVLVCQFGVMFFPDKGKSYREALLGPIPPGVRKTHPLSCPWRT